MIKVKMMITLSVDEEDYPIPSDGDVTEDFEEYVKELFYDIDGVTVQQISINGDLNENYLPTDYQNFIVCLATQDGRKMSKKKHGVKLLTDILII